MKENSPKEGHEEVRTILFHSEESKDITGIKDGKSFEEEYKIAATCFVNSIMKVIGKGEITNESVQNAFEQAIGKDELLIEVANEDYKIDNPLSVVRKEEEERTKTG